MMVPPPLLLITLILLLISSVVLTEALSYPSVAEVEGKTKASSTTTSTTSTSSTALLDHETLRKLSVVYGPHGLGKLFGASVLSELIQHHRLQQHAQAWHLTSTPSDRQYYLACVAYADAARLEQLAKEENVGFSLTYSSLRDDLFCGYLEVHGQELQNIQQATSLTFFVILEPVPALAKLDVSIPYLQRYLMGLEEDKDAITESSHPIIAYLQSTGKSNVGVAVQFKHHISKEQHEEMVFQWKERLLKTSMKQFHVARKKLYPGLSSRHGHVWKTMLHQLHSFHDDMRDEDAKTMLQFCSFSNIEFKANKYGSYVRLPFTIPSTTSTNATAAAFTSFCLNYLITMLADSSEVAKLALTLPMQLQNNFARTIVQSGSRSLQEPYYDAGVTGEGVVVGVSDTGIDENHCFFKDSAKGKVPRSAALHPITDLTFRKVVQYVNYSGSGGDYADGHGSHVAGTIAGYCESNSDKNTYRGMAPMAKLAFFDIGVNDAAHDLVLPDDVSKELFGSAYQAGARIHSNSWGGGFYFDSFCLEIDEYLYKQDDMLLVFAAGNSGGAGMRTVLSPGISKNALAVGCTQSEHAAGQNLDYVAVFSSHGPTFDGRIKPDIVAPGYSIYSAKATKENTNVESCEMEYKAGTSMATPVVAGNTALIIHYFQKADKWAKLCNPSYALCQKGSFTPSGILLKGLIMHSGKAIKAYDGRGSAAGFVMLGTQAPDVYQGYGRMDLSNILPLEAYNKASYMLFVDEDHLTQLSQRKYSIAVNNSNHPLRITLAWFDPPNSVFASKFLLHDLDLVLISPSGVTYYGNAILDNDTPGFGAKRDDLNNNEQLTIHAPSVGEWNVLIQCKGLTSPYEHQKYALIITGKGIVTKQDAVTSLSMSFMQDCVAYGAGQSRFQLGVSKWSRVVNQGWGSKDFYYLNATNNGNNKEGLFISGSFAEKFSYDVDELCVYSGCYEVGLELNSNPPVTGVQVEFPQCNVYLSPLAPKQKICIDPAKKYNDSVSTTSAAGLDKVELFDKHACRDQCSEEDHYEITVELEEESGAGWSGAYYVVLPDPLSSDLSKLQTKDLEYGGIAGNLEFSLVERQVRCLRKSSTHCYHVQLSFPKGTEDVPELYFPDAYAVEEVPPTDGNPFSLEYEWVNSSCPYFLNMTHSYAKMCVDQSHGLPADFYLMTFYQAVKSTENLGQLTHNIPNFWRYMYESAAVVKGSCAIKLPQVKGTTPLNPSSVSEESTISPTAIPTAIPSMHSTSLPTVSTTTSSSNNASVVPTLLPSATPTWSPSYNLDPFTFDYMNFSCLTDCMDYPGADVFSITLNETCFFLLDIFTLCDSFSIAYGYCPIPTCAQDCSIETWCYFGAGTVASCPAFEDHLPWVMNNSAEAVEVRNQCVSTLVSMQQSSLDDSWSYFWSSTTISYFIVLLVMAALIGGCIWMQHLRIEKDTVQVMQGNSYGNLPDHSISGADEELQEGELSSDDGFNTSYHDDVKPTTSMKDQILTKGKEMLDKGKDLMMRKGKNGVTGKQKKGDYEMLPLQPGAGNNPTFVIQADDDDEEEDESGNGGSTAYNPLSKS